MKKLNILAAAILAATAVGMASCDVELALPENVQDVQIIDKVETFNNKLSKLYEEVVVSGNANSERLLNNILDKYARTLFGDFYEGENALIKGNWKAIADASNGVFADEEAAHDFYNTIVTSIKKSFWGYVTNSTYQKQGKFDEELWIKAQRVDLYDLPTPANGFVKVALDGAKTWKNVLEYFHVSDEKAFLEYFKDYIEEALLPTIYRKALVEKYLIDNNSGTLGRSYARKVQYVALPSLSSYEESTRLLVQKYCELVLAKTDAELTASVTGLTAADIASIRDLNFLNKLYKGYFAVNEAVESVANSIYTAANFTPVASAVIKDNAGTVIGSTKATYLETSYGQLVDDFKKLSSSRWETGTSTDFTGSGAYAPIVGFNNKVNDIVANSKVTEGWYTSSGLSDLPSTMKTRLFKTQVANEVDNPNHADNTATILKSDFTWRVSGSYYMRPETIQSSDTTPYAMYDDSSKTWYIIRVDEAVKSPKLENNKEIEESYANRDKNSGRETMNQIIWDIADLIADSDSYKKAARQYYVEKMQLGFHDDDIYSYFEETFPDLYE